MKNLKIVVLVMALIVGLASPSFAVLRKDLQTLKGKVVSISVNRAEITVRDGNSGKDVSFTGRIVDPSIVIGSEVLIMYKVGTNTAKSIHLVVKKGPRAATAKTAPAAPVASDATQKNSWY